MEAGELLDKIRELRKLNALDDTKTWKYYPEAEDFEVALNELALARSKYCGEMTKIIRAYCDYNFVDMPSANTREINSVDGSSYLSHSRINQAAQNILAFHKSQKSFKRQGWAVFATVLSGIGGLVGAFLGSAIFDHIFR